MATDRGGYPWLGSPDTVKVWSVEPSTGMTGVEPVPIRAKAEGRSTKKRQHRLHKSRKSVELTFREVGTERWETVPRKETWSSVLSPQCHPQSLHPSPGLRFTLSSTGHTLPDGKGGLDFSLINLCQ